MILSCGETLIDMVPGKTAAGEDAFVACPGGGACNTAVALGRLGAPAGLLSGLSTDTFGMMLSAVLAASNVDTTLCIRSSRPTPLAFVRLVNGDASYAFYDENSAGRMITPGDLPILHETVCALLFGGISLVIEPAGATYEALMRREAASDRVLMLDPNIRPILVNDDAAYRARLARMIAQSDIVRLSHEDLHWLEGPCGIAEGAAAILARGPKIVFVTEGAAGAHAFTATTSLSAPAHRAEVVDTIGAGDTFNASVLAALYEAGALSKSGVAAASETTLRAALNLGTRAAAITVARAGANPPWSKELV